MSAERAAELARRVAAALDEIDEGRAELEELALLLADVLDHLEPAPRGRPRADEAYAALGAKIGPDLAAGRSVAAAVQSLYVTDPEWWRRALGSTPPDSAARILRKKLAEPGQTKLLLSSD